MGTISDYFWLVWRQTKEKTQLLQPWRAYAAIGGGLLSAVVQHFSAISMTPWSVTAWAAVGGVSAYAVLTLGEFFYKMLLVVPVEIWKEHQNHIETQNQRIAQLEEDRPHFERSKITRFHIEGDHQRPDWIRVLVFVVLRNLGADSAVQGWNAHPERLGAKFIIYG